MIEGYRGSFKLPFGYRDGFNFDRQLIWPPRPSCSVLHNFGARRKDGDESTGAEPFFGAKHDNLFEYFVNNVKIPGKPQAQIRKKTEAGC